MPRYSQSTEDMIMHIDFGKRRIEFDVRFEPKEWFRVSVDPEGQVHVTAPEGKTRDAIARRVRKKAPWIIRQKDYFERFRHNPVIRSFVSGETHNYLGRQYRLNIIPNAEKPQVKLKGRFFEVSVPNSSDTQKIEEIIREWYREHAKRYYQEQLLKGLKKMKRHGIETPVLVVRAMRSRWGSCTKDGKIILNLELIKTPSDCVEYVIMHELCHLIEHNHTERFYRLLSSLLPNWKAIKNKLDAFKPEFR